MLDYLKNEDGLIQISKDNIQPESDQWLTLSNQVQIKQLDVGVFQIKPELTSQYDVIFSCGIHGNETAPIEMLSRLLSQIVNLEIIPRVNLLFILGNPESMKIAERFVSINMNRLFAGAYKQYELNDKDRYELERAARLESIVTSFFTANIGNKKLHLDLHTAIKPSFHKTFAIRPFNPNQQLSESSRQLLLSMGIEAVLQHNKPSTTFSAFTVERFAAEAYTLELGKVKKFGENDPADFVLADNCLRMITLGKSIPALDANNLIEYKVVAEIIKQSEDFKFYVSDKVENFTAFPQGYLMAEDTDYSYRVAYQEEAVVFPNVNVPVGQRVAVMVARQQD